MERQFLALESGSEPHYVSSFGRTSGKMPMEISFSSAVTRSGHTEYTIVVVRAGSKRQVVQRYSELLSLHKKLVVLGVPLPAFPPKKAFGNLDPEFVRRRQVYLQSYFRQVVRLREVRQSLVFKQFLGLSKPKIPAFDSDSKTKAAFDEISMGVDLSGYS